MGKKSFLVLVLACVVFVAVFSCFASAAIVQGSVYNLNLDKMSDVVVTIDTQPKQLFVVKNGSYSFNVPQGDYVVRAVYKGANVLSDEENISVRAEGSYVLDLIIFPSFEVEEGLLQGTDLSIDDSYFKKTSVWPWVIGLGLFIFLAVIAFIFFRSARVKKQHKAGQNTAVQEKNELDQLLDFIRKQGGRVTQKDIRKQFPSSEAKISLIITELEHKGKIEKIKKGRGNIIMIK